MAKVMTEEVVDKQDSQIDQIPKTYVLREKFWETLSENLPKKSNILMKFIATYRNRYIDMLETPYPVDYPPWMPTNNKVLYQVTGIDEKEFVEGVETIRGFEGYKDPYLSSKGGNILLNMIARWYIMNKKEKEFTILKHYIGYNYYWSVFTRYFKVYKPKLEAMRFTINELSYKNALKAAGSVDKWLYNGVNDSFITYNDRLLRGSDWELMYIGDKIRYKFDGYMRKLYPLQEKNEREKNFIFISSSFTEEGILDNTSGVADILTLANAYASKFFIEPVSETAITAAKAPGSITERDIRNTVFMIADNKENHQDVIKFYQSLFYIFLAETKFKARDIGTTKFYVEMRKLYTPGNSIDPNRIAIKDCLDKWLKIGSRTYRASNRDDTLNKFRRSIYDYFIAKIMSDK